MCRSKPRQCRWVRGEGSNLLRSLWRDWRSGLSLLGLSTSLPPPRPLCLCFLPRPRSPQVRKGSARRACCRWQAWQARPSAHKPGRTKMLALGRGQWWGWGGQKGAIPSLLSSQQLFQGAQRERPHRVRPQLGARLEQSHPVAASRQIPGGGTQRVMGRGAGDDCPELQGATEPGCACVRA